MGCGIILPNQYNQREGEEGRKGDREREEVVTM